MQLLAGGMEPSIQRRISRHHSWAARVQLLPISWELALMGGLERPVTECLAYFFKGSPRNISFDKLGLLDQPGGGGGFDRRPTFL